MADTRAIAPSDLVIDESNPRLQQPSAGQREALREIAKAQGRKLLVLAKDILKNGLSPSDLPIVMPMNDDKKRYRVLEGNRRLAALKVLESPESIAGVLDPKMMAELRDLSKTYQDSPIEYVQCAVVKDRDEARRWIELRHTGENQGAGVVPWGGQETARFRSRSGKTDIATQALDFLEHQGGLSADKRSKVPITTFKRLLDAPEIRKNCGFEVADGVLNPTADEAKVVKALKYIAEDLASGDTKVADVYSKEQRAAYAANMPANVVVKQASVGSEKSTGGKKKAKRTLKRPNPRDTLIPSDCTLSISETRIQEIEQELRHLNLEHYPNAVSVLLRVFLELSIDAYITRNHLSINVGDKLSKKMEAVLNDLLSKSKLTAKQAIPVRQTLSGNSLLGASITMMNAYVHNPHACPAPSDLRATWGSLQFFVGAVWSI